ncbi:MAG: TauD/TfdA family dioxygenase, partial [Pseudomonadota bacterium]
MKTNPLHPRFGLVIEDVDLNTVSSDHLFPEIRQMFDKHSALLFRTQNLTPERHEHLASLFGPLENRDAMSAGRDVPFEIPIVSNETTNGISAEDSLEVMNLQGNMLWHTDSTFLPIPALSNILVARVLPSSGGATELASTRTGWADLPEHMKERFRHAIIWHRLSHSRSKISAELAALPMMNRWPDRPWKAVWTNPITGEDALYIASHAFAIEGMGL